VAFSSQAYHTDRATAGCRRSQWQLLRIEGVAWSAQRVPTAVNLGFLDPEQLLFHSISSSVILTRLWQQKMVNMHKLLLLSFVYLYNTYERTYNLFHDMKYSYKHYWNENTFSVTKETTHYDIILMADKNYNTHKIQKLKKEWKFWLNTEYTKLKTLVFRLSYYNVFDYCNSHVAWVIMTAFLWSSLEWC
jgi:hypothetical protein